MIRVANCPTERKRIKNAKPNRYWVEYFRESFEEFTGISSATIGSQLYTLEESMERHQ